MGRPTAYGAGTGTGGEMALSGPIGIGGAAGGAIAVGDNDVIGKGWFSGHGAVGRCLFNCCPFALISQASGSIIRYMQDRPMSIVMQDMDHYDEMWMISGKMTGSILQCAMSIIW